MTPATDAAREAIKAAYLAGAMAVHEHWQDNPGDAPRGDPEFNEAASDYAASIALTEAASQPREGEIRCPACHVKFRKIDDVDAHLAALTQRPPEQAGEGGLPCERCQGNGEIVTNWGDYLHPKGPNVTGEEGTEDCPDCDGTGRVDAPEQAGAVPAGWRLVPVEPTEAMLNAGIKGNPTCWSDDTDTGFASDVANDVYLHMLSAAPTPPDAGRHVVSIDDSLAFADMIAEKHRLRANEAEARIASALNDLIQPDETWHAYALRLRAALLADTPPDAGPGEIPAGMVAWRGGDSAPADFDPTKPVMYPDGDLALEADNGGSPFYWHHSFDARGFPDAGNIIAYTPKAHPQTPPDAGIGSDGAGERV